MRQRAGGAEQAPPPPPAMFGDACGATRPRLCGSRSVRWRGLGAQQEILLAAVKARPPAQRPPPPSTRAAPRGRQLPTLRLGTGPEAQVAGPRHGRTLSRLTQQTSRVPKLHERKHASV